MFILILLECPFISGDWHIRLRIYVCISKGLLLEKNVKENANHTVKHDFTDRHTVSSRIDGGGPKDQNQVSEWMLKVGSVQFKLFAPSIRFIVKGDKNC